MIWRTVKNEWRMDEWRLVFYSWPQSVNRWTQFLNPVPTKAMVSGGWTPTGLKLIRFANSRRISRRLSPGLVISQAISKFGSLDTFSVRSKRMFTIRNLNLIALLYSSQFSKLQLRKWHHSYATDHNLQIAIYVNWGCWSRKNVEIRHSSAISGSCRI